MVRMWPPTIGTGIKRNWALLCQVLMLVWAGPTLAQDLCNNPNSPGLTSFTLGKTRACIGELISITSGSTSYTNIAYFFDYKRNGFPPPATGTPGSVTSTTYSAPGTYTILQTGSANGTGFAFCQTVEVVENGPVSFSVSSCGNRTANIAVLLTGQTGNYDRFNIEWGDGTAETRTRAEVQAGSLSHAYMGQLTYFLVAIQGSYDNGGCPGQRSSRPITISGSGPPAVTALTTVSDGTISISYQGTSELIDLQQKGAGGTYQSTGQTSTNGSFTVKTDTKQVQCFKLVAASTCPGIKSQESEEVCSLVLTAQAASQQNTLTWTAYAGTTPIFAQYQLSRNSTNVDTESSKATTSFADKTNIQCGVSYCYTLKATLQGQTTTTITSAPVCVTGLNTSGTTVIQKPAVTALTTNTDGTITIKYQSNDPIELQQKDAAGAFNAVSTTAVNGALTFSTDTKQVQCFKLATKSTCGTAQESEVVCSLVMDAKAVSKENDLTWQPYGGSAPTFIRYRIYRNGTPLVPVNNKATITYADRDNIECGTAYCYYIEATVQGTTQTVITSAPVCVTGINSATSAGVQTLFATVENGTVRVQGIPPTTTGTSPFTITVSRMDGGNGAFQPVGRVENSLLYIDKAVNTNQQSYCYQLTYQGSCGLPSPPSPTVCTVLLASKSPSGIDWSAESPFAPGTVANFILETLDTQDNTTTFLDLGGNTHFDPNLNDPNVQRYRYRIVAYDADGTPSYSNYYEFRQEPRLYVPSAFTPNGDGANDTFLVIGFFVDQFSLTVYSRWGVAVFHTTDPASPWDGTTDGQPAPAGEYAYHLEIADLTGKRVVKSGPVLLIR